METIRQCDVMPDLPQHPASTQQSPTGRLHVLTKDSQLRFPEDFPFPF